MTQNEIFTQETKEMFHLTRALVYYQNITRVYYMASFSPDITH